MFAVELLKNRYVERERLARSGGGCDNDVFAFAQRSARFDLVPVQPNALFVQVSLDVWGDLFGRFGKDRFSGRQHFGVRNLPAELWVALQDSQNSLDRYDYPSQILEKMCASATRSCLLCSIIATNGPAFCVRR